jgi:hypothetical protein
MPRGDRTGPAGHGAMTGRAMGYCAGYAQPGYMTPGPGGPGRGYGRFGGWGRGYRRGYGRASAPPPPPAWGWEYAPAPYAPAPATAEDETAFLRDRASFLERELESIKGRLAEMDAEESE